VNRRAFITLLGSGAAWPLAARAQQTERVRRIGVLLAGPENDPVWQGNVTTLREGLARLGWTVGRNLQIDYFWRMNDVERTRAAAAELLKLAPEVIVANGSPAVAAVRQATRTIPIVFTMVNEPVAQGFVQSLAHFSADKVRSRGGKSLPDRQRRGQTPTAYNRHISSSERRSRARSAAISQGRGAQNLQPDLRSPLALPQVHVPLTSVTTTLLSESSVLYNGCSKK
jgi:hypothetical protein